MPWSAANLAQAHPATSLLLIEPRTALARAWSELGVVSPVITSDYLLPLLVLPHFSTRLIQSDLFLRLLFYDLTTIKSFCLFVFFFIFHHSKPGANPMHQRGHAKRAVRH